MVNMHKKSWLTVGEIAHMGVTTVSSKATIEEAIQIMLKHDLRDVIFEVDSVHYIFTTGDLLDYVHHSHDFAICLSALSPHPLKKVLESENVVNAFSSFGGDDRYLGVSNAQGDLIGVLSYSDVISSLDPSVFVQKKTVGDVLMPKHRFSVSPSTLTKDVLCHLTDVENAVIVVEDERPIGILTAKDALRIIQQRLDIELSVTNHMTTPVDMVASTQTISEVMAYLQSAGFKRAVIVDEQEKLLGVLTQSMLAGFAFSHWSETMRMHTEELSEVASELASKAKAYKADANTDPLTLIGNRRSFNDASELELIRAERYNNKQFSMILIDIDYFKKVNDVHGHLKGDEILKALAAHVQALLREIDVFCRWGGEEFVVLLPETDLQGAHILAERIREGLCQNKSVHEIGFSISAGVTQYQTGDSLEVLLKRVDSALYRAKEGGRNRVELA